MNTIAYVDDDLHNLNFYRDILSDEFNVETFLNGEKLLETVNQRTYDCFVVDIYMPKLDGFDLATKIRTFDTHRLTPIFFVTSSLEDAVKLDSYKFLSADFFDRMTKREELIARIKNRISLIRETQDCFHVGNLSLSPKRIEVCLSGSRLSLTLIEYKILYFFSSNPNQSHTKQDLVDFLWPNEVVNPNNLNTHIYNLRQKILNWDHEIIGDRKKGFFLVKKS